MVREWSKGILFTLKCLQISSLDRDGQPGQSGVHALRVAYRENRRPGPDSAWMNKELPSVKSKSARWGATTRRRWKYDFVLATGDRRAETNPFPAHPLWFKIDTNCFPTNKSMLQPQQLQQPQPEVASTTTSLPKIYTLFALLCVFVIVFSLL